VPKIITLFYYKGPAQQGAGQNHPVQGMFGMLQHVV